MGIIFRQAIKNTILSYAGIGLGVITTLFLYPRILAPEEFGLIKLFTSFTMIGAHLGSLGFRGAILRFMPAVEDYPSRRSRFIKLSFAVPLAGFGLYLGLYFALEPLIAGYYAKESALFLDYKRWTLPMTLFIIYYEILNSFLRSMKDSVSGLVSSEIILRSLLIVLLLVMWQHWLTFPQFVMLFVSIYGVSSIYMFWKVLTYGLFRPIVRDGEPESVESPKPFPRGFKKLLVKYSGFTLFGGFAGLVVMNIDILMIGSLLGLRETAIYAMSYYMVSVMTVPLRSLERIGTPLIADAMQKHDLATVQQIYQKTSMNGIMMGFLITMVIWVNLEFVFTLLPETYRASRWIFFWLAIGRLIDTFAGLNGSILVHSKYFTIDLWTILALMGVSLGLNATFIPLFGLQGAALATSCSLILYNGVKLMVVWRGLGLHPFTKAVFGYGLMLLPFAGLMYFVPKISADLLTLDSWASSFPWIELALEGVLVTLPLVTLYGLGLFILPISKDAKQGIRTILAKVLPGYASDSNREVT
ncbi:MAG: oligosaccharide flippase family protein [Balneolaceae bacterium]|nr:oligosaccharide flippase family protein [Balneolaceae bacterium]MDR9446532.1 oligosaccharide flippase family protein [Balneolaceae bacterium]